MTKHSSQQKKPQSVLLLDGDILGLAAGLTVCGIVMGIGFWRDLDLLAVVFRAGLAFVITYAAVFLLVRFILSTTLFAIAEQRKREEEARKEERAAHGAGEGAEPPKE